MFKRYELHNHTNESDANLTCRQLVDHMVADGVDCFTEASAARKENYVAHGYTLMEQLLK